MPSENWDNFSMSLSPLEAGGTREHWLTVAIVKNPLGVPHRGGVEVTLKAVGYFDHLKTNFLEMAGVFQCWALTAHSLALTLEVNCAPVCVAAILTNLKATSWALLRV